jgi:hypothetical protein
LGNQNCSEIFTQGQIMKRKMKKFDEGGGVEEMKKGLFSSKEDKEQEDARSTYFKSPSPASRSTLPSAKESSGTSYNTEYKEEKKAKPAKKPETSQKFPLKEPEYKDTKAKIGNQAFPVEEPKYRGTVKSKDMGSQKFPVEEVTDKTRLKKYRDNLQEAAGKNAKWNTAVYGMAKGGSTASKRADGCAMRGKTRGRMV